MSVRSNARLAVSRIMVLRPGGAVPIATAGSLPRRGCEAQAHVPDVRAVRRATAGWSTDSVWHAVGDGQDGTQFPPYEDGGEILAATSRSPAIRSSGRDPVPDPLRQDLPPAHEGVVKGTQLERHRLVLFRAPKLHSARALSAPVCIGEHEH